MSWRSTYSWAPILLVVFSPAAFYRTARAQATSTITVPSGQPYTDTGIPLTTGERVTVTATGTIYVGALSDPALDNETPNGQSWPGCAANTSPIFTAPGLPCWSLIGKIGSSGAPFEVGTSLVFTAGSSGEFYLGVNDNYFPDNSGAWTATISTGSPDSVNLSAACVNGLQVDVNGGASPGASVTSISWNWGDGTTTTGFFPRSHEYSTAGQFTVNVTAHYSDGSTASSSEMVSVGPGILSNCLALTITAGRGGSVNYQASVGNGTVLQGTPQILQLDFADDLNLSANPSPGNSFTAWTPSAGITAPGGGSVSTASATTVIVVAATSTITANFSLASGASATPTTVSISANPPSISESSPTPPSIVVTVLDQNGFLLPGVVVSFTSSVGSLSAASAQTDVNGLASVTLSLGYTSQAPVIATVSATAGNIASTASVKFTPPATPTVNWIASTAFNVAQIGLPLSQYLSTPIDVYNACLDTRLCTGTVVNPNSLPTANLYLITPVNLLSPNISQFSSALSQFFGINQCAQAASTNCIPKAYNPAAVVILELPAVQAANILFDQGITSPVSLCFTGEAANLLTTPCIQSTTSGYVDLAFIISESTSTQKLIGDLLQALASDLSTAFKLSGNAGQVATSIVGAMESNIAVLLDVGDLTVNVITTDLAKPGALSSYALLDLYGLPTPLNSALAGGLTLSGYAGKILSLLDATAQFIGAVGEAVATSETVVGAIPGGVKAVISGAQITMTSLDIGVEILPTINTSLAGNQLYEWFENGVQIATSFVDPAGATILPSFFDASGNLVLGYDVNTGTITYASPNGILFLDGDGYLALLNENLGAPSNYSETLTAVGTGTAPMPYSIQIRSYNRSQPIQGYSGMLGSGNSVNVPIEFNPTNGALVPAPSLSPAVVVSTSGTTLTVVAEAFLSDGSPATATDALFILNGQQFAMTQVDSSTFEATLDDNLTSPTVLMVYMISPNLPGGFAATIIAPISTPTSSDSCNGVYDGFFAGNLRVSAGQDCIFVGGTITGNVKQTGGSLSLASTTMDGNLLVTGGGNTVIGTSTKIRGNLHIQNVPASTLQDQLCGATVSGNVLLLNNEAPILIGSTSPLCPANTMGGSLLIMNNTSTVQVFGNSLAGNLHVANNTGSTSVFGNTVTGTLRCQNNASITGGGNTARQKQGQCASF